MHEIQNITNQTPIEIALGIDENGMTTAGKLYDFLGMDRRNYSRWFKNNFTKNQFAEENVDYFPFVTNEECGGQASQDAKLTSAFAKKLSMQQKNERGEQARNYFVGVEDKAKDLVLYLKQASSDPMKLLKLHYEALEQVDKKVDKVENRIEELDKKLDTALLDLPLLGAEADEISNAVKRRVVFLLGGKQSNAYQDKNLTKRVFIDCYRCLKHNFGDITTYKAIRRKYVSKAVEIVNMYAPPLVLVETIKTVNAQQTLESLGK